MMAAAAGAPRYNAKVGADEPVVALVVRELLRRMQGRRKGWVRNGGNSVCGIKRKLTQRIARYWSGSPSRLSWIRRAHPHVCPERPGMEPGQGEVDGAVGPAQAHGQHYSRDCEAALRSRLHGQVSGGFHPVPD